MVEQSSYVWCDGAISPSDQPLLNGFDRGATVGLGCFETFCTVAGECHSFDLHFGRFLIASEVLGGAIPEQGELQRAVRELLGKNDLLHGRARVRMTLYATQAGCFSLVITAVAVGPMEQGELKLALSSFTVNSCSPLAGIKSTSYAGNVLALEFAQRQGADEALMLNQAAEVCEGATSNVFWVKMGTIYTPSMSTGCLPGVTRHLVIELCRKHGIAVEEVQAPIKSILGAEAAFVTNAVHGIRAVSQIDEVQFASPSHPLLVKLATMYSDLVGC